MDPVDTDHIEVIYSRQSTQNTVEAKGETLQKRALPSGKKYHVFISYSNFDTDWVKRTVDKLENAHGFICCEYERDNTPGTPLLEFASDSIKNSYKTLVVMTKEAMQSSFVLHELDMAIIQGFNEKRKCVVPILLEDCEVPDRINVLHYIDARNSNKRDIWWPKLIKELDIECHYSHWWSSDTQRPGVFTCPAEGMYKFQVYSLTHINTRTWIELYKNQELVASLYGYTPLDYGTAGNAVILSLRKEDVVWVKARDRFDVVLYGLPSDIYTTFSGVRLKDSSVTANGIQNDTAFSAILTTHRVFTQGSNILYDKLLLNEGNGYNINTGVFTARHNGIYIFYFFPMAEMGSGIWQELYHNSDYVCALHGLTPTDWANAGNTAILHLKSGDTVQIRARGTNKLYGEQHEIYSTFSGILITTESPNIPLSTWMVAFSAGLSTRTLVLENSTVVFDRICLNLKIAYNQHTGVFTAPTAGLYEFNVHMLGLPSQLAWLELYHNYKYIISLWSNPLNHNGSAGNSAVIQLNAGDVVYVKARDKRNFILYGGRDQIFCTFSGYLLSSTLPA